MALSKSYFTEYVQVNSMSNTPNTINWKGTPIPETWYAILTEFTAKYAINVVITKDDNKMIYLVDVQAGGPYVQFVITSEYFKSSYGASAFKAHLETAVKSMNLQPTGMVYTTSTTGGAVTYSDIAKAYKDTQIGGTLSAPAGLKLGSNPWNVTKSSSKLNSLYEMYGMVEPKIRYCEKHRPTAAQVIARIEEAEKQAEVAKTLKSMSPELAEATKAAFGQKVIDSMFKSSPLLEYLKKPLTGFSGNYYTDYGKQLEANAQTGAKPYVAHPYNPQFPGKTGVQCQTCEANGWGCCCEFCVNGKQVPKGYVPYTEKLTKTQLKKLKKAALKAKVAVDLKLSTSGPQTCEHSWKSMPISAGPEPHIMCQTCGAPHENCKCYYCFEKVW